VSQFTAIAVELAGVAAGDLRISHLSIRDT